MYTPLRPKKNLPECEKKLEKFLKLKDFTDF